ncbi:MAG: glycosyltransferase, partial [Geminicoccales bacterium]
ELHIVGDGHFKSAYERKARGVANVVFYGRMPHDRVPLFIAAADLCLAPYDPARCAAGRLGYSTMKIPEYLSCGRPVASVPSGRIPDLIEDGVSGFLLENDLSGWLRFLDPPPSRARLREMAQGAASVPLTTWEDTARAYLALCERALATSAGITV